MLNASKSACVIQLSFLPCPRATSPNFTKTPMSGMVYDSRVSETPTLETTCRPLLRGSPSRACEVGGGFLQE